MLMFIRKYNGHTQLAISAQSLLFKNIPKFQETLIAISEYYKLLTEVNVPLLIEKTTFVLACYGTTSSNSWI